MTSKRVRVTIQEIRQPELDAYLVARSVADQLERRVAFRRAMKQSVGRAMRFGAKGVIGVKVWIYRGDVAPTVRVTDGSLAGAAAGRGRPAPGAGGSVPSGAAT